MSVYRQNIFLKSHYFIKILVFKVKICQNLRKKGYKFRVLKLNFNIKINISVLI